MYHSKQRGYLELDILMGTWATDNLASLDTTELHQFAELLTCETPDLFKWVTGQEEVPDEFATPLMARIRADVAEKNKSDPATHAENWYDKRGANGQNWN